MAISALPGAERRINLRLLAYWEKLRKGRVMPTLEELNPDDLRDLWDSCFIIHVVGAQQVHTHYHYLGQFIIDSHHQGTLQGESGPMISLDPAATTEHFFAVLETFKPLMEEGEFINRNNNLVKYRQCLLPLGQEEKIEGIFGGMSFTIVRPKK